MKHLHLLTIVILLGLFLYQCYLTLPPRRLTPKALKISTHITYALVILSGGWMLTQLMAVNAPVQWVFAKILLLFAAISASIKAFRPSTPQSQSYVGIFIATVAYVGIISLAIIKPANFM